MATKKKTLSQQSWGGLYGSGNTALPAYAAASPATTPLTSMTGTYVPYAPDPRIDTSYETGLSGLDTQRSNAFDTSKYNVGRAGIDTGLKFGDSQHQGAFTDAAGQSHNYDYDTYSFDPNGYETNGVADINKATFDPSDPFSKMSLLQQSYEQSKAGSTNSLAARGQLFSGALGHQRTIDHTNASGAFDTLMKSFQDIVNGANQSNTGAISNYGTGATGLGATRLNQQIGGYST